MTLKVEETQRLESRADQARGRLMDTLDALDQRRHRLAHPIDLVKEHPRELAIGSGALLLVVGGAAAFGIRRWANRGARTRRDRLAAVTRLWKHPERVASSKPRSFLGELGRRVLLGAATFVAMELAKRGIRLVLARSEEARILGKPSRNPALVPPDVDAFTVHR